MNFQLIGRETRLQNALRALAESQADVDRHNGDLAKLKEAGYCVRSAMAINRELREVLAQCRRDVIWARDRIRFGFHEKGVEPITRRPPASRARKAT